MQILVRRISLTTKYEKLVKTEFHLHTAETSACSMVPGKEIIHACAEMGFGCVIVTDHYLPEQFESMKNRELFLKGYHNAKEAATPLDIVVLPGMEFRFANGFEDFLVYGMEEQDFAALPIDLCQYSLPDFYSYCHEHGYLLFQAHPFRPGLKAQNPTFLDGIEVQNGNIRHHSHNNLALAFARRHNLLEVSGGDVHQFVDVRQEGLMVPRSQLTPKGIVQFLKETPKVGSDFEE